MKAIIAVPVFALSLALASTQSLAEYPSKPIHLIVPFASGGPSDTAARTLGQALSKLLRQPIVVEDRPGADGQIAVQALQTAAPDGYTLLWGVGSMVAIPLLQKHPPAQSVADFTPISRVGRFAFGMYVHPSVPAKSVAEFVAYARAHPDKLGYASSTLSEYLAAAEFMKATGTSMLRVPYKGAAQAMPDLIAGRVQVTFGPTSLWQPYAKSGQLRVLANLLPQRIAVAPDVATMVEAGVPGVSAPTWQAIFAPTKTPREVVDRLSHAISLALQDSEVQAHFDRDAFQIEGSTPEVLADTVREDLQIWTQFFRENGITPE